MLAATKEDSTLRGKRLTARLVLDEAKNGDKVAVKIAEQYGYYLGKGLAVVASVTNPEMIVLGGGVSRAGGILIDMLKPSFIKYCFPGARATVSSHWPRSATMPVCTGQPGWYCRSEPFGCCKTA
jgi:glucokinase